MKIKPLFDRLLVTPYKQDQSAGGIIIPPASLEKPQMATVVAMGNGIEENGERVRMLLSVGDVVIYSKYAGSEITIDQQTFILIKQCDILGILEK